MTSSPRDDIVKEGPASSRTWKFGSELQCNLIIRGRFAPYRLEIYTSSSSGKIYNLENVECIKFCDTFDRRVGLKIRFCGSRSLYFNFPNEKETSEWMEGIQMHSLAVPTQVTSTDGKFPVFLMPNSNCHLNGRHLLIVTDDAIRICDALDATPLIVWPVHTIRFYGNSRRLFSVATTSRSETGEGMFHFDALCAKKAELIYNCVAASVTHMLQVAVSRPSVPSRLPYRAVPRSTPIYDHPSIPSDASATDEYSINDYCNHIDSPTCKETFAWNHLYLKRIGASLKKPKQMPVIYGLDEPKRELLDVFNAATDRLDRFAFSAVLYGPSNCGKQLLVEAAAASWGATLLCLPAHCLLQLDRNPGNEIQMVFDIALMLAPCIVLIKQLQHILPSSSASESDRAFRVLQTVKNAFGVQSMKKVAVVGTISDLSEVENPLLSLRWMAREIYVPPPSLKTRRQVFAKELQGLLNSPEGSSCLDLLEESTAGFDFVQLTDLYHDLKKMVVSDAFDCETRNGRCKMMIRDRKKVEKVLEQNVSERKAYEESGLSSAKYYVLLQEPAALFVVELMANEVLSGVSHCFLRIADSSLDLLDLDPTYTIVSWKFRMIRQFTWTPLCFVLEVGRMSPTEAGEFHFETMAAKVIFDRLNKTLETKQIQLDVTI